MKHGMSLRRAYAYAWITLGLFLLSLAGYWLFGGFAYVDEQTAHGRPIELSGYTVLQSHEGDERKEAKLDAILRQLGADGGWTIAELDQKYPRR
jgi:hypothetical protein